ncbi:MAG TPA: hypothetical protein VFQ44_12120 [Streptosporangiaceae bacterium]|nr:hypothetical protein [Streptosporangiaceae bacterium]
MGATSVRNPFWRRIIPPAARYLAQTTTGLTRGVIFTLRFIGISVTRTGRTTLPHCRL